MSKLIYAKSKAGFEAAFTLADRSENGKVYNSIAFLEDGFIHTHGQYFKIFKGIESLLTKTESGNTITITDSNGGSIDFSVGVKTISGSGPITASATNTNGLVSIGHTSIPVGAQGTFGGVTNNTTAFTARIPSITFDAYGHPSAASHTDVHLNTVAVDYIASGTTPYYLTGTNTQAKEESTRLMNTDNVFFTANGLLTADTFIGKLQNAITMVINNSTKTFNNSAAANFGTYYAPITGGLKNQILQQPTGATTAPIWVSLIETVTGSSDHSGIPSAKAVYDAVQTGFIANDAMRYKGVIDASTNPNYPASEIGDTYKISVAGKIGGAAGIPVEIGDMLIASAKGATGTEAQAGTRWNIVQANIDGAVINTVVSGLKAGGLVLGTGSKGVATLDTWSDGQMLVAGAVNPKWVTAGNLIVKGGTVTATTFNPATEGNQTLSIVGGGGVTVTGTANTITISAVADSNTATAVSNILEGSNVGTAITYKPYAAKQAAGGKLYTAATNPTFTDRLNYDGHFYATKLYSGGAEVLTTRRDLYPFALSYKEGALTAVRSVNYDPRTNSGNTLLISSGNGILMTGTADSGNIGIAHATTSSAATVTAVAAVGNYISSIDGFGHVTGARAFGAFNITTPTNSGIDGAGNATKTTMSYAPSAAKTLNFLAGDNVNISTSGVNVTISATDTNTWRNVSAYKISVLNVQDAAASEILASTIGTQDLQFGAEFIWSDTSAGGQGPELKIGWAEIDTLGNIIYTV